MDKLGMMLLLLVLVTVISSLFIMLGWYLFMVPVFGMQPLTFFQAFGFSLLAACFKGGSSMTKELTK